MNDITSMHIEQVIPVLKFDHSRFLDKSVILYGASGSGKSVVIVDILFSLKDHIEQIIVVSPTDRQNHTYDRGVVPLPCIHYTITEGLLDNIWSRQEALVSTYTRANDATILRKLFDRIPNNTKARDQINVINNKLREHGSEIGRTGVNPDLAKAKLSEMESTGGKLILLIFKQSIKENRKMLSEIQLSKEERYTLKYFDMNPRIVVIFDDCTDLLLKHRKHPVIQKMFFQGRWAFMTILIACHTDLIPD